jgi:hypothetical protein
MLDSGASEKMMSLKVMRQLGLETMRPRRNACGIESRPISKNDVIENVKVKLTRYLETVIPMDIVVLDVPDVSRMFLSMKFIAMLGGTLYMDLIGLVIPMDDGTYTHPLNIVMEKNHVEEIDIDSEME